MAPPSQNLWIVAALFCACEHWILAPAANLTRLEGAEMLLDNPRVRYKKHFSCDLTD